MKKVLALVLALVLVLSLAACGGGGTSSEVETTSNSTDIKEFAFGKWECTYSTAKSDSDFGEYSASDKLTNTLELFEGGKFSFSIYNATKKDYIKQDVTGKWTIVDGCIQLEPDFVGPLKPDYEKGTLTDVTDKNKVYSKK